jgi:hypothetical protein
VACTYCGTIVSRPLRFSKLTGREWVVVTAFLLLFGCCLLWLALFGDPSFLIFGPSQSERSAQFDRDLNLAMQKALAESGGDPDQQQQVFNEQMGAAIAKTARADHWYRAPQAALCSTFPFLAALGAALIARYLLTSGTFHKPADRTGASASDT